MLTITKLDDGQNRIGFPQPALVSAKELLVLGTVNVRLVGQRPERIEALIGRKGAILEALRILGLLPELMAQIDQEMTEKGCR